MTTYQRNERNRRLISAMLLFTLVLSMFGNIGPALKGIDLGFVSTASACQPGKPCEDAPGQTKTETVTIEVVPGTLVNNGGNVVQGNGNGVVTQALEGTNNATVTILVQPDTVLNLPENTNATVIIAGATDADTASDLTDNTATNTATANTAVTNTTVTAKDTKPAGADCSSVQGVVLDPPAEQLTAQQIHDLLNWDWKNGPVDGRNRIRATNVCISNGGHGSWTNNLPEPANSRGDRASWMKLQRWADLYNAGQLVIFMP